MAYGTLQAGAITPGSGNTLTVAEATTFSGVVTVASPVINTAISGSAVLDEDNLTSNSATKIATQQSIKAYADALKTNSSITTLGTVTAGNLANSNIVYPSGMVKAIAIIGEQVSAGTNGGTASAGNWFHRTINTEFSDTSSIVSLSSNRYFDLAAGRYTVQWTAPFRGTDRAMTRLFNITTSAVTGPQGTGVYLTNGDNPGASSTGFAHFVITGTNRYEIDYRVQTDFSNTGLGVSGSFDTSVYTLVLITLHH